jgi:1-acyl-sn-glycerol-3-phosphate acyltransferase
MLLIRSQFANLMMYLMLAIVGIFGLPLAIWSRTGALMVIKAYCASVFWLYRVICGLHVEFRGKVPEGEVLVCSKHMSFLDILMLAYMLPRVKFIMKRELIWAPVLGFRRCKKWFSTLRMTRMLGKQQFFHKVRGFCQVPRISIKSDPV